MQGSQERSSQLKHSCLCLRAALWACRPPIKLKSLQKWPLTFNLNHPGSRLQPYQSAHSRNFWLR